MTPETSRPSVDVVVSLSTLEMECVPRSIIPLVWAPAAELLAQEGSLLTSMVLSNRAPVQCDRATKAFLFAVAISEKVPLCFCVLDSEGERLKMMYGYASQRPSNCHTRLSALMGGFGMKFSVLFCNVLDNSFTIGEDQKLFVRCSKAMSKYDVCRYP